MQPQPLAWTDGQVRSIVFYTTKRFLRSKACHRLGLEPADIEGEAALVFVRATRAVAKRQVRDPVSATMACFKVALERRMHSLYRLTVAQKRDADLVALPEDASVSYGTAVLDAPDGIQEIVDAVLEGHELKDVLAVLPPKQQRKAKKELAAWGTSLLPA